MISVLQDGKVDFALGDEAYDSEKVRQPTEQAGIFLCRLSNLEIVINEKMGMVG